MTGSLLGNLDTSVDAATETDWEQEVARRFKDLESSHPHLVSWSDVRRRILGPWCRGYRLFFVPPLLRRLPARL